MNDEGKLILALAVFAGSYIVLSHPECRQACRNIMAPMNEQAGKALAAILITTLLTA